MAVETTQKIKEHLIFDIVLELCFTGNESLWDRMSEDRKLFEQFKRGEREIKNENNNNKNVIKMFQGLLIAAFAVFPGIARSTITLNSEMREGFFYVLLERGRRLSFDIGCWSNDVDELIQYYKEKILGWENPENGFTHKDWLSLRDAFKYSKLRLEGEKKFLEGLQGSAKKVLSIIIDPSIKMDSLLVLLSLMPLEQLNLFFMDLSLSIPDNLTATDTQGLLIDVKQYYAQSTVGTESLFKKIRILLMLYARQEMIVEYTILDRTKEIMAHYLQNVTVCSHLLENVKKAIHGQYQPRVDIAKAISKLLS